MGHSPCGRVETIKAGLLRNNSQGGSASAHPPLAKVKELDNRKAWRLVIHINDAARGQVVKGYTLSQIVEIVRAANCEAAKCISTARKLQSGDILLVIVVVVCLLRP